MKKILFSVMFILSLVISGKVLYAANTIDKSLVEKGAISITTDEDVTKKLIRVQVALVSDPKQNYVYTMKKKTITMPLQMGNGQYKVTLLESTGEANKYKPLMSETIDVKVKNENDIFLHASPFVDYASDMVSIKGFNKILTDNAATDNNKKIVSTYNELVRNYKYDNDKIAVVEKNKLYLPVLDDTYKTKKGICFDYSALNAGVLRSNGIPTRLVMGFAEGMGIDVYHAWNEVYKDGKWVVMDTTTDAAYVQANQKINMEKDAKLYKVVKIY